MFVDPWGFFDFNTIYSYNSSYNKEIEILQSKLLNLSYYDGPIDGLYGDKTVKAVQNYQHDKGLVVDGIVGVNTWSSMGLIYHTQADIDAGVKIYTIGYNQYFDISEPVANAVEKAKFEFESHYLQVDWFIKKVKNNGEWNVKQSAEVWSKTLGISKNSYDTPMLFYGRTVVIDDIGNITFGYLGRALGLSINQLKTGSILYHIWNHALSDFENEFSDQAYVQLGADWYGGIDVNVRFSAP